MDKDEYVQAATESYIIAALWTEDLGSAEDEPGVQGAVREAMESDVRDFVEGEWDLVKDLDPHQTGHDFWLTRNGHGTGFWDRGHPGDLGKRLTDACRPHGAAVFDNFNEGGEFYYSG